MADKPLNQQEPKMLPKRGSGKTVWVIGLGVVVLLVLVVLIGSC